MSFSPNNSKKKDTLKLLSSELNDGNIPRTLNKLRIIACPSDNFNMQSAYSRMASKILLSDSELPVIRIAFLSNTTLDHWVECLKFWLLLEGFRLDANILPLGTWRQHILDKNSDLYRFNPDIVWLFLHSSDLRFNIDVPFTSETTKTLVGQAVDDIRQQITTLHKTLPCLVITNNIIPQATRVFGNFEGATANSLAMAIARFNFELANHLPSSTTIFDIAHIATRFGLDKWEDARLWHHSKHPFSLDAQGEVAFSAARLLAASRGRAKKCIILDLDNTLWGGVVGDDGAYGILIGSNGGSIGEAYASFQAWLKALAVRGIALAVCSKNNELLAKEPFLKREDMILKLDDFVAFKANWYNKADNIRAIAQELNLGLDSFIFIDDNPAERTLVRQELPQVAVPELPIDPADYIRTISAGHWFETLVVSKEDLLRVQSYRQNTMREQAQQTATDLDSYLRDLNMQAAWGTVDASSIKRITQLINKTNQFHLTTTRYTESQLSSMMIDSNTWIGQFSLSDHFGDHGIIAAVILKFGDKQAFIDTWTMSCRVFSRTMEHFIFNLLCDIALKNKCNKLVGEYKPTPKNEVVSNLYENFGGKKLFKEGVDQWIFELDDKKIKHTSFINSKISNVILKI